MKKHIGHSIILMLVLLGPITGQDETYPLEIGDIWQYSVLGDGYPQEPLIMRVEKDTVLTNGITYRLIKGNYSKLKRIKKEFQRKDGNKVFQYNTDYAQEEPLFDTSATIPGTLFTFLRGPDTVDVIFLYTGSDLLFGKERKFWKFAINVRNFIDDEQYITVVKGIGVTAVSGYIYYQNLFGAVIDGIIYGNLVNIFEVTPGFLTASQLKQNYPNPFNPTTTIEYQIPGSQFVELSIYNILGQKVATLVSEKQKTGTHKVEWDASGYSSGVYFYRLKTERGFVQTRKLVVLK